MKVILVLMCLFIAGGALALTKQEIKLSLEQMKQTGMFTPEQIAAAEKQLMGLSQAELDDLEKKGLEGTNDPKMKEQAEKIASELEKKNSSN